MFDYLFDAVLDAIKAALCWLIELLWSILLISTAVLLDLIPDWLKEDVASGVSFVYVSLYGWDEFIPFVAIGSAITFIVAWRTFWIAFRFSWRAIRG